MTRDRFDLLLLGDPVAHSRSPVIQSAALDAAGLSGSYTARTVDEIGMVEAADEVRSGAVAGANITMPHKGLAFRLSDVLGPEAEQAASVNTWVSVEGAIHGHSTDVVGVRGVFARFPEGPVTILGSGGAAAAALVALSDGEITVRARSATNAARLVEAVGVAADVGGWDKPASDSIVVNCTPIGMRRGDRLPDRFLSGAVALLDMSYGPEETLAVGEARARRIPYADGIDLLVAQAAGSFLLWTNQTAPADVLEAAARGLPRS